VEKDINFNQFLRRQIPFFLRLSEGLLMLVEVLFLNDFLQLGNLLLGLVCKDEIRQTDLHHQAELIEVTQRFLVYQPGGNDGIHNPEQLRRNNRRTFFPAGLDKTQYPQTAQRFPDNDTADPQDLRQIVFLGQLFAIRIVGDVLKDVSLSLFDETGFGFHGATRFCFHKDRN
jgi:hypothetical protein